MTRNEMRMRIVTALACMGMFAMGCTQPAKRPASGFLDKLSDYGFFTGTLKDLQPAGRVHSYELATPLFTDYTIKKRFIVLPEGSTMQYTQAGPVDFPDGTYLVKNFAYRDSSGKEVLLETRLLHKDPADGNWKVMNYKWNAQQTEAEKWITGDRLPITLTDDAGQHISTHYQIPNTNDCKRCHASAGKLIPIGPKARNLNHLGQLEKWAAAGILQGLPEMSRVEKFPVWNDSVHYTVNQRARAYLDVNCAHCHTKGGDADNTGLFLEYGQETPAHLGILKGPVSAGNGAGGLDHDVVPGDPANSILHFRMNSNEPGTAMPELARTIVHREGVDLIAEWIRQLPKSN